MQKHKTEYERMYNVDGQLVYSHTKIFVRRLMGLAFVPQNDVRNAFAEILDVRPVALQLQLADEMKYFDETWVSGKTVAGRTITPATYPPACWNTRERTLNGLNRTNNHCESFHAKLASFVGGSGRPTIWGFISGMKIYQSHVNNAIASMRQGHNPARRTPKEILKNRRILNATKQYESLVLMTFLDGVMEL